MVVALSNRLRRRTGEDAAAAAIFVRSPEMLRVVGAEEDAGEPGGSGGGSDHGEILQ